MTKKQKLDIVHDKTELHAILSQIELSDTPYESHNKIKSSFLYISQTLPQNLLLIPKRNQRIIYQRK